MAASSRSKKPDARTRFKHARFQKALGQHCRKLRTQRGYSVNRLAAEGEKLSPDAIIRLESGGIVTTVTLLRYAEVLGYAVKDLFDFEFSDSAEKA